MHKLSVQKFGYVDSIGRGGDEMVLGQ